MPNNMENNPNYNIHEYVIFQIKNSVLNCISVDYFTTYDTQFSARQIIIIELFFRTTLFSCKELICYSIKVRRLKIN